MIPEPDCELCRMMLIVNAGSAMLLDESFMLFSSCGYSRSLSIHVTTHPPGSQKGLWVTTTDQPNNRAVNHQTNQSIPAAYAINTP